MWCFAAEWTSALRRLTASDIPSLDNRVPEEEVSGSTPDISAYAMFDFFQPVWHYTPTGEFPYQRKKLGYFLGVYEASIDEMAFHILVESGSVDVRKSVWGLTQDEWADPKIKADLLELEVKIKQKIGDGVKDSQVPKELRDLLPDVPDDLFDDDEPTVKTADGEEPKPDQDEYTPEAYDE